MTPLLPRYLLAKARAGADRHLCADNAMAAIEFLFAAEHVHRAALAMRVAGRTPGQFRHHCLGIDARRQHVAMVAIGGDDLVVEADIGLHAHHHRFLADIEMTEAANQSHPVQLSCPLLETADQQHVRDRVLSECSGVLTAHLFGERRGGGILPGFSRYRIVVVLGKRTVREKRPCAVFGRGRSALASACYYFPLRRTLTNSVRCLSTPPPFATVRSAMNAGMHVHRCRRT